MLLQGQLQKGGEDPKEPKSSFHSQGHDSIHPRPHRTTTSTLPCLTESSGDVTVTLHHTLAILSQQVSGPCVW